MPGSRNNRMTEEIWRTLSDRLRQFIQSRVKSAADVDDILQEVFLRIHHGLESVRDPGRLEPWVFQITRNVIVDHYRRSGAGHLLFDSVRDLAADNDDSSAEINLNVAGWLPRLIEQLPEDQRRAVSLYELQGLSQQEIATREAISLSGAKSRIQRGRRQLETLLRECCRFEFDRRRNVIGCEPVNGDSGDCGDTCD